MRVLDLGCGDGLTPDKLGLPSDWQIIGIDVKPAAVAKAHSNFPRRIFVCSAADKLPVAASSFDRVISNVALPYTDIPKSLTEIYRVLTPGGTLLASLHSLRFALEDLRRALPKPELALHRTLVLANGIAFHFTGRGFGESFQTERGIRLALQRANFAGVSFRSAPTPWFVEATKP